jgi:hypothetical protein
LAHNFGLVEIDWNALPAPVLKLEGITETEEIGFSHQLSLADLQ